MDETRWLDLIASIPAVARLPLEPADRCLVAQARTLGIPLVTADAKIRVYPHLETLW